LAAFFYWRHLHPSRPQVPSTAARKIPAAIKPELAASSPKSDSPPAPAETVVAPKAATAGFLDFVIAVFSPSAQAETIQPAMQPAVRMVIETPKPAKRVVLQTAAANASPVRVPQELTAEQKRLKVAQDGFGDVMNLAYKNPDVYGFMTGEHLESARLGSPLPIYIIAQQGRDRYAGQPVNSLLKPGNEWVYPIILENHVRFLVQVRYDGHDYVLGHGSRALAMAYEKILARWPAGEGFHPKLATMPNLPSYYFTIPELPDQNITDVTRMLDFNPSLSPATVMLASWR
jgi:hypothetical protein